MAALIVVLEAPEDDAAFAVLGDELADARERERRGWGEERGDVGTWRYDGACALCFVLARSGDGSRVDLGGCFYDCDVEDGICLR